MSSYYEKMLATGEVKCIDEEIPFEIPQGWEWCRLNEVATSVTDFVASGSFASLRENVKYYSTKEYALLVRTKDLSCNFSNDLVYTNKHGYDFLSNSNLFGGELILPNIGASIGKVFIVPNLNMPMTLAPNSVMIRLDDECTKSWLYNVFSSSFGYDTLWSISSSTAQGKFNKTDFRKVLVPIPPIEEQNRIVTKIKELSPYIEKYSKAQEHLDVWNVAIKEILQKSILQEAIQGKLVPQIAEEGTAQELLEQIKTEKQKLVKEGKLKKTALNDSVIFKGDDNKYWEKSTECMECIDDKIPFEIPSTWCWVRHNQLFEISGGSQPPKSQFVDNPKSGYIRLYQIRDYGSNPMPVYIPKEKANKITKEGDILLARYGGSLGKVFWAEDGAYNVAMAKVIPLFDSEFVNKQYLFLFYQSSIYQYLVKDHSRSAQAGFNKDDLTDLFFPLPPLEEQSRIVEKYKSVTSIINR